MGTTDSTTGGCGYRFAYLPRALLGATAFAMIGACSSGTDQPETTTSTTPTATDAGDASCLSGEYDVVGVRSHRTSIIGRPDVTEPIPGLAMTFRDDRWQISGSRAHLPITGPWFTADVAIDAQIRGSVAGSPATFTVDESAGAAVMTTSTSVQDVPLSEVAEVLAPSGVAQVRCDGNTAQIDAENTSLTLQRAA
ncbi:hypothetical protein [Skermania piniformis]|uniref:Lipoprotein n=1 Tax=Skermania pinensis TaxID=39122 RepID=A0ABX8SCU0_9ACTN|nr:hypothetical protein [Skermania piniformis]QXQ15236.1 hypothetical protein KV203_07905 [Skermania piniformis]